MAFSDLQDAVNDTVIDVFKLATAAVHAGATSVDGIFYNEGEEIDNGFGAPVIAPTPTFQFKTGAITPAKGDTLLINSTTYTIRSILDDDVGITELQLEAP